MPPAGFEPAIPAGDRPQILALARPLATGIGLFLINVFNTTISSRVATTTQTTQCLLLYSELRSVLQPDA